MCNHCGCGSGWSQPVIPAQLLGITSFTAPFAGGIARSFAQKLADVFSAADFNFSPGNTAAGNLAAWANLIAAAQARPGGQVYIPPGTYDVSNTLLVDGRQGIHLMGLSTGGSGGAGGVLIRCTDPTKDVMQFKNTQQCSLSGVKLGYTGNGDSTHYALRLTNTYDTLIRDVGVWPAAGTQTGNGVLIERDGTVGLGSPSTYLTVLEGVDASSVQSRGFTIRGTDATHIVSELFMRRCVSVNCGLEGLLINNFAEGLYIMDGTDFFGCQRAIHIDATAIGSNTRNILIHGCILDSSDFENLKVVNGVRVIADGNWISVANGTAPCAYLTGASQECVVQNNKIYFGSGGGITVGGTDNSVLGNQFKYNVGQSIFLDATSASCKVFGNVGFGGENNLVDLGTGNIIGPNGLTGNVMYLGNLQFFAAMISGDPLLMWDANDFLKYSRTINAHQAFIGGAEQFEVSAGGGANDTPLALLDITAGTIKRVSRGAIDSGGSGFRLLRIPN